MSGNDPEIGLKSVPDLSLGPACYDGRDRALRTRAGRIIPLRRQSAEILACLAQNAGSVVSKDALIAAVWDRGAVSDDSLAQCIADIRKALDDGAHRLLRTYPKQGYMLVPDPAPDAARSMRRPLAWAGAALALALLAVLLWSAMRPDPAPPAGGRPVIAVLPFDDLSTGAARGWLSDAISEGVITELARFKELAVIARNSSFAFRDRTLDMAGIREALGADYVVEGSQQKSGDRLRVTAQLVNAHDGTHVWADSFDRDLGDLFAVQAEITRMVAAAVGHRVKVTPLPGRDRTAVTALHHLLQMFVVMKHFSRENHEIAFAHARQALAADPDSAYGYIAMAFAYRSRLTFGWGDLGDAETRRRAEAMADKALALAPENWMAHYVRARIHDAAGESDLAIARFQRAAELNPSAARVFSGMSSPLLYVGRSDEALAALDHAMKIDPLFPEWTLWQLSWALWQAGDCDGALAAMLRQSTVPPTAHRMLAAVYACLGREAEARAALAVFLQENPDATIAREIAREGHWTAPGALDRWVADMRVAGMPE